MKERVKKAFFVILKGVVTALSIGSGGYFIFWVLHWLSFQIMNGLEYAWDYTINNCAALIIFLISLTISCILGALVFFRKEAPKERVKKAFFVILAGVVAEAFIGFVGYFLCWGLNWLSSQIMSAFKYAWNYTKNNWGALAIILIALTIASILGEMIFTRRKAPRAKGNRRFFRRKNGTDRVVPDQNAFND